MRTCEQCGQEFSRRKTEAHWQYEKRKFCSRPCADLGRARTRVPNEEFKARYRQKTLPGGRKMLGVEFTPHKTKRVRAQTCGPACKSALLSRRNAERRPQQGAVAIRHLLDLMEGQDR